MKPVPGSNGEASKCLAMRSRYASLMENPAVMRWYQNVCRGSRITGDVYFRRLGGFTESNGITPAGILRLTPKRRADLLLDTVSAMEGTVCP
ncbi:MAG: hypothetical protein HY365_00990 [Candidatus Aenigmarchaeota archaeon]|nr:hypothetical protein [Candidatus Aenigmarchaeota archaeon]